MLVVFAQLHFLQTMAAQLMRSHAPKSALTIDVASRPTTARDEDNLTPKERMRRRKLADANARMQQVNLHVQARPTHYLCTCCHLPCYRHMSCTQVL